MNESPRRRFLDAAFCARYWSAVIMSAVLRPVELCPSAVVLIGSTAWVAMSSERSAIGAPCGG